MLRMIFGFLAISSHPPPPQGMKASTLSISGAGDPSVAVSPEIWLAASAPAPCYEQRLGFIHISTTSSKGSSELGSAVHSQGHVPW